MEQRNQFIALCQLLSEEGNQCYKLSCGKCRVSQYISSFKKIIAGLHPDNKKEWGDTVEYHYKEKIGPWGKELNIDEQKILSRVVSSAKLEEINKVAKFPNWLGYLGWVLTRCERYEKKTRELTKSLIPQFLTLIDCQSQIYEELIKVLDSNYILNIHHLELIEKNLGKHQDKNLDFDKMNLLTKIEKKHLKYLSRLLDYGSPQLKSRSGARIQFTHLQNFLLFNQIAIHNYTEAIYLLCEDARPHAAYVLLRSLFEAYTNVEYVKFGDSERKLALFAKNGFFERGKIANGFDKFIEKYPKRKESISVLEEKRIDGMKEFVRRHIIGVDSANQLKLTDKYPDIFIRSTEIDKNVSNPKNKGDNELYYHLVFRYLSPYAHLNAFGLEMFLEKELNKEEIFQLGRAKDVHLIILQTYLYYFVSFNNLFQHKVLDGHMPAKYQKYFEELKMIKIR